MRKRLLTSLILVTGSFWTVAGLSAPLRMNLMANAQAEATQSDEPQRLYYTYYDQQILLDERRDQIAIRFTEQPQTRGGFGEMPEPAYLKLERDLQNAFSATRSIPRDRSDVEVRPLGDQYALVTLSQNFTQDLDSPAQLERVVSRLTQPYVEAVRPVFTRGGSEEERKDSIVITSEIVASFPPETTDAEAGNLVSEYGLKIVRPLQFSPGRYLLSTSEDEDEAILAIANRLDAAPGILSATPNFIQTMAYQPESSELQRPTPPPSDLDILRRIEEEASTSPTVATTESTQSTSLRGLSFPNSLFPLQWALNSSSMRPSGAKRTDVHAVEAWSNTDLGNDATVAVIDSLIQWDHPDLVSSVYRLPSTVANPLPGEVSGWDFSSAVVTCDVNSHGNCAVGDPDTRISAEEISILRPHFQNTIALSDRDLLATYPALDGLIHSDVPDWTAIERAAYIRYLYQSKIAAEFHGTWSAGVIAARPQIKAGMVGVAPQAQFLPVRVFGLGGAITSTSLIEASGYAAARGVDVINFSLGSSTPNEEFQRQLLDIMTADPAIVIVAAAGNENENRVSHPAAIPEVVAVGSTNISGHRSAYSSYGAGLDVVAPGGETYEQLINGILTAGGTWVPGFWQGLSGNVQAGGPALDTRGRYVGVQGTSFAAPIISGIVALMKDVDDRHELNREQLVEILQRSADHDELAVTPADAVQYRDQVGLSANRVQVDAATYFFGDGLVDAEVAVEGVRQALD